MCARPPICLPDGIVICVHTQEDLGELVLQSLKPLGSTWAVAFTVYDILAFYNTRVSGVSPTDSMSHLGTSTAMQQAFSCH